MKWKCANCSKGPCMFEKDGIYLFTGNCPIATLLKTDWKPMSGEEPEQKEKIGLPEWLKVGNFVWLDAGFMSIKNPEYQGVPRGIYKIISIKSDSLRIESIHDRCNGYFKIPWGDADEIQRLSMRPVFPQPYTFETAPVALKVRRKDDWQIEVARLEILGACVGAAYRLSLFSYRPVQFDELLENWEQLDGWPCGTFDEETVI